jgi:DNA-binding CsgD family transcriptional regulator
MSKVTLTKRQMQVLRMLVRGFSDEQIAERLELARGSVQYHLRTIYKQFGLDAYYSSSRVKLTLWAIRQGLVKIEPKQAKPVYIEKIQYKYNVGNRVCVRNHRYYDVEGEIVALMPYSLVAPAYDVQIDGMVVAVSERSLERIEQKQDVK